MRHRHGEDEKQETCLQNYERYSGRTIQRHIPNKSDAVEYRQILETCDEAEVLIDRGEWRVIRRRQTIDDMLSLETL